MHYVYFQVTPKQLVSNSLEEISAWLKPPDQFGHFVPTSAQWTLLVCMVDVVWGYVRWIIIAFHGCCRLFWCMGQMWQASSGAHQLGGDPTVPSIAWTTTWSIRAFFYMGPGRPSLRCEQWCFLDVGWTTISSQGWYWYGLLKYMSQVQQGYSGIGQLKTKITLCIWAMFC